MKSRLVPLLSIWIAVSFALAPIMAMGAAAACHDEPVAAVELRDACEKVMEAVSTTETTRADRPFAPHGSAAHACCVAVVLVAPPERDRRAVEPVMIDRGTDRPASARLPDGSIVAPLLEPPILRG